MAMWCGLSLSRSTKTSVLELGRGLEAGTGTLTQSAGRDTRLHGHTIRMRKQCDWSVPCRDSCVMNGTILADCATQSPPHVIAHFVLKKMPTAHQA